MYLLALIPVYIITYFIWILWLQIFFWYKTKMNWDFFHILIIIFAYIFSLFIVALIPEAEFANRFQHAIWGWFLVTLIWYLAYLQSWIKISRFQLFHILVFVAFTLWIINELAESVLQVQFWLVFAPNIEDTWYDLWANTFWALLWVWIFSSLKKR
jgi:hypothetical protein